MKQRLVRFFRQPCYPFLFSLYPTLALLAMNIMEVRWSIALRPLVICPLLAWLLFLLLNRIYHQKHRAALTLLFLEIVFFAYGHVYSFLQQRHIANPNFALPLLAIILTLLSFLLSKVRWLNSPRGAFLLNTLTLGLVIFTIGQGVAFADLSDRATRPQKSNLPAAQEEVPASRALPDIYYIVLDSYARADRLQVLYQYDNTAFLKSLQALGFYVASCSQSNYGRTDLSLASALNMDYIQNLHPDLRPEMITRAPIFEDIKHSTVRQILEAKGYRTVAFATGFAWSELTDASEYIAPSPFSPNLNEFETLLLRTTLVRELLEDGIIEFDPLGAPKFRERTLLVLNTLPELPRMPGPKFIFVHLIIPHPPFVFGPNGEEVDASQYVNAEGKYTAEKYAEGYTAAITFLNARLIPILEHIIRESETPPVILLQGDHGPWLQSKARAFDILNAYYLPGHTNDLYSTVSPVNSFRILFNAYFNTDYPLLPDYSYLSPVPNIYNFTLIPNPCQAGK